jgi:hypothetical protein
MILDGFGDLQPCKVVGGNVTVRRADGTLAEMELFVTPTGAVTAKPVQPAPIDQLGRKQKQAQARWNGAVDQL